MAKTVVGLFESAQQARAAVHELIEAGFSNAEISLVVNDPHGEHARLFGYTPEEVDFAVGEDAEIGTSATARGASIGAAAGGVAGLLAGLGLLMIPGIGPVLAAGPIAAVLGGMGIGAVAGGMIGALAEAGVPEEDAQLYSEGVQRGNALVVVNADDDQAERAAQILNQHQPVDLGRRAAGARQWRGLGRQRFAYQRGQQPYKPREAGSGLDFGPGARGFIPGQPMAAVDRAFTELGNYQNKRTGAWDDLEPSFRADYEHHYARTGRRWEDYAEAYRFGFDAARREPYGVSWEQAGPALRESWEGRHLGEAWTEFGRAVQLGWESGQLQR